MIWDKGRDGITLYDALSKQLGLTLALKDVPVAALAIGSVNRNPTPNVPAAKEMGLAAVRLKWLRSSPRSLATYSLRPARRE